MDSVPISTLVYQIYWNKEYRNKIISIKSKKMSAVFTGLLVFYVIFQGALCGGLNDVRININ